MSSSAISSVQLALGFVMHCFQSETISVDRYDEKQEVATHLTLWRRSSSQGAELDDLDGVACRPGRRGRGGRPYPIYLGISETDTAATKGWGARDSQSDKVSVVSVR